MLLCCIADDLLTCLRASQPPPELQPVPAPLPQWGATRLRSSRVNWPAGCSAHLVSSLAGQNGQAALRAAGLTDQYRQRLLHAAPGAGAGAAGQLGRARDDEDALDAAMQPLQAAAALPAAVAALKLRQQQLKLLQEQCEYQQRYGQQSEEDSEDADDMVTESPLLAAAAAAATAAAGVERLAAAAAVAAEGSDEEQLEGDEQGEARQQGCAAVFQAMNSVLQEVCVHNYGLGAYLTELLVDWPEAKKVGTAAAAAAASVAAAGCTGRSRLQSLADCALVLAFRQQGRAADATAAAGTGGGGGSAGMTVSAEQQQLAQQRSLTLHQLVTRCLQQQEAAEQSLLDMRGIVDGLLAPPGQVVVNPQSSLQQLQQLHKQHAASLGTMLRTLRQLQAGLTAAVASLQDELRCAGQEVLGEGVLQAVEVLVGQCWKDWQAAWDHVLQAMKLLGLSPPHS